MERIFYRADVTDAYSGLPIYVFDTSYLPLPEDIDYHLFVPTLMHRVPQEPYVVIMFSCGLNNINWVWGIYFLKAFLNQDSSQNSNVENLHKIIAVHESWFVKSICSIFSNFLISRKSINNLNLQDLFRNNKPSKNFLISCDSLSELSSYVDIVHLKLSLNIYRHDCQVTLSPTLKLHSPINPVIKPSTDYSPLQSPLFYHHFYQIFHIIDTYGQEVELLFHKPGKKLNTDILFLCLMRNQLIWVNDWDLNCIASCFKKILTEVSGPLLPVDSIQLPMKDDFDYTVAILDKLFKRKHKGAVLFQIIDLCSKIVSASQITKHTPVSISKSLSHPLTHEPISHHSQHRVSIAIRYLKNSIVHWPRIRSLYADQFKTVQQIIDGFNPVDAAIDESYNTSHSISLDDGVSSEEDRCLEHKNDNDNVLDFDLSSSSLQSNSTYVHSPDEPSNKSMENPFGDSIDGKKFLDKQPKSFNTAADGTFEPHQIKGPNHGNSSQNLNSESGRDQHCGAKGIDSLPTGKHQNNSMGLPEANTSKAKSHGRSSSIQIQFPPQKYKFERKESQKTTQASSDTKHPADLQVPKLPVIRGRKVGELTRIFEERTRAIEILKTM